MTQTEPRIARASFYAQARRATVALDAVLARLHGGSPYRCATCPLATSETPRFLLHGAGAQTPTIYRRLVDLVTRHLDETTHLLAARVNGG